MHNSQDAINPHLLLHTKAGPDPPDSHDYYRIGQPQQHILGEASYLHYAPQAPPPSLITPSPSNHVRGAGRASIEARYRALMRNMLMYQQMRIRAMNTTTTTYVEHSHQRQYQQQQQEETTLFSSFSLPQNHHSHHQHLEYSLPSSFHLPPPAEPTILDATALSASQAEIVAPTITSSPPLQSQYHQPGEDHPFEYTNPSDYADEPAANHPNPGSLSRRVGGRPKPASKPSDGSKSSSRISRSKSKSKSKSKRTRPLSSAVQFALEELTSSSSRFTHYNESPDNHPPDPATTAEPLGEEAAILRTQDDVSSPNGDSDGMRLDDDDAMEDLHARAARDLVLECFVSSMSEGLG
ncbi:hypothetical protein F4810DRAFT_490653 [Camillea tinctor]|nr:hypothetical protein F4810DRAFT_490653 [Camillea tinctor]